jgi:hypothetical protein
VQATIRRLVYAAAAHKATAQWIGDHSPRRLAEALPGAPNILVVRDGRDVLVSQAFHSLRVRRLDWFRPMFRSFAARHMAAFQADPDSFKNTTRGFLSEDVWVRAQARDWAAHVRTDLLARKELESRGTQVHAVSYEDLHREFDERRAQLYRFLKLDPALAAAPSEQTKTMPGFKIETPTSDNRKGIVGDWKNYFDERIGRIYREEAGEALIEAGYEKDLNW